MHGFALNVATDMAYLREHIVACGIGDRPVTSLRRGGRRRRRCATSSTSSPASPASGGAAAGWSARTSPGGTVPRTSRCSPAAPVPGEAVRPDRHAAPVRLTSRLAEAGVVDGLSIETRKPEWLRPKVHHGAEVLELQADDPRRSASSRCARTPAARTCRSAGPTARRRSWCSATAARGRAASASSTRASPRRRRPTSPQRVAEAIDRMGLDHAVLTMVARDDLADGGMAHVAACVEAIRDRRPRGAGRDADLRRPRRRGVARRRCSPCRPDVLNHNVETVARLQRAVRPSAGYARSLSVLARAKAAGLMTKSGLIVGMGETDDEVVGLLADLAGDRRRHRHDRPVPPPDVAPPAGRPLGRAGAVRRVGGARRGARHRPRRGQPADPVELPRQGRRRARPRGRAERRSLRSAPQWPEADA